LVYGPSDYDFFNIQRLEETFCEQPF
jgi:hypothetical protein